MRNAQSSSHHGPPPPPPAPWPLRRIRNPLARPAILAALSAALHLAYATPVPLHLHHRARLRLRARPLHSLHVESLSHPLIHLFSSLGESLARRNDVSGPILDIASYNTSAKNYRLPTDYVILTPHFNGGFIVLAYIIAFIGSLCTLELLIRRTTNSGWRNQALLAAAGFCFGAVSTFAMHFVFNNALGLKHPLHPDYPVSYLSYDAGFTILSLVVSCLAMTIAFFIMGTKLGDWKCGSRTKRRHKKKKDRTSRSQRERDEYREWKSSHTKGIKVGSKGPRSLLTRAASHSTWSALDPETENSERSLRGKLFGAWQKLGWKDGTRLDEPENLDNDLQEIEFRLGKAAVEEELARKARDTMDSRMGRRATIPIAQSLNDFSSPSTEFHHVRSSLPEDTSVFTPNFSFPTQSPSLFPQTNTTDISQSIASNSESYSNANHHPFSARHEWRRASLPTNILFTQPPKRPSYSGPSGSGLSRIQSLPEGDIDPAPSPATILRSNASQNSDSFDEAKVSLSPEAQLHELQQEKSASSENVGESKRDKRAKVNEKKNRWGKLGAFLGFDIVTAAEVIKVFVTGITAGFGVVGMHYIGQASIIGIPYVAYKPAYVVGSVIIACGAVVIALYIMFIMLRPKLKHTWWSKILVALILAVAVCAMHFCGTMGTIYGWPAARSTTRHSKLSGTNAAITGIVSALAFAACIACAVFFLLHSLHLRREQARRRRVVVASIMFDEKDRILVHSTDGMLPMYDIASLTGGVHGSSNGRGSFIQSLSSESTVLGMDLSTGHEAFVSALKLSWMWRNPIMSQQNSMLSLDSKNQSQPHSHSHSHSHAAQSQADSMLPTLLDIRRGSMVTNHTSTTLTGSRSVPLSISKFLEKFSTSSGHLAMRLTGQTNGITRLGVLYDQILTTGWVKLQNSSDTVSKGQLIFLVRRVNSAAEQFDLVSRHYMFADPSAVASALQRTLSVPFDHIMPLLDDIRVFCDSTLHCTLQPGKLYAGVAVVQATPFDGLRILLEKDKRGQLPMREMCTFGTSPAEGGALYGTVEEIGEAVSMLQGFNMLSIISRNLSHSTETDTLFSGRVSALLSALELAIIPMLDEMLTADDMEHILPRLTLHPVLIPLTPGGKPQSFSAKRSPYTPPYLIVFYANYDVAVNTFTDKWLPFSLFRAQSACVMSQKVQVGTRMERIWGENEPDGSATPNVARRPSKVQFEFPTNGAQLASGPTFDTSIFNGYSFPESDDNQTNLPHYSSSSAHVSPPVNVTRKSSLVKGRFSSSADELPALKVDSGVAGAHDVNGTTGLGIGQASAGVGKDALAKPVWARVGAWDQDWLLHLLRDKLRTET
ncbi:hypothetical protein C345_07038 [Cryptococcus neoformans A2-102-5]|nr:hypothetical protein C353_07100 [Cryptococcus neoformans var. grubii AD1-83a]OXG55963.1 hypothetical protein C351_07083 [Cryptococcus neoformans var. grubii c8]OXG74649.1 hypothetical protein C346_07069 [Cryptococcus neoformans var. grubii D17-1]OXG90161.1 hypothetical protein C345_07038 [Cryptococcus neoformans var. grubii A2-102-5]OXH00474.1 hypothetical protein C369_07213 [Cryptococcus neoformans var. grubii A5-35-17]OXH01551.1 hypothetical protein C370_07216 [Cryptococcus neoformans var